MIDQLTDAECEITERVARRLNVVIEAVEGLQGQADAHEAMLNALQRWIGRVEGLVTEEVGQAADPVEAPTVEDRLEAMQATWQIMSKSYTDACAEAKRLRAERDALQARVAELEKEDTERLERGREKARHMEKEIATLKHAVRGALGDLAYGHTWTPYDTQYVRDAIAAVRAALGEEAADAE